MSLDSLRKEFMTSHGVAPAQHDLSAEEALNIGDSILLDYNRSNILDDGEEYETAVKAYLIAAEKEHPIGYARAAIVMIDSFIYDEMDQIESLANHSPESPEKRYVKGFLAMKNNDWRAAMQEFKFCATSAVTDNNTLMLNKVRLLVENEARAILATAENRASISFADIADITAQSYGIVEFATQHLQKPLLKLAMGNKPANQ